LRSFTVKMVLYNRLQINYKDISYFEISKKEENVTFNEYREYIIGAILNKKIPNNFYDNSDSNNIYSRDWRSVRDNLKNVFQNEFSEYGTIIKYVVKHKGGRKFHYDFEIEIHFENDDNNNQVNPITRKIEFKFNCNEIDDTPQFVSPCKPDQYFNDESIPFTSYFYDNYFLKICEKGHFNPPSKEIYLNKINNNKPECLLVFLAKYKSDKAFKNFCKKMDAEGIKKYIDSNNLDIKKLNKYLLDSQKDKIYLLYKDGDFKFERKPESQYTIKEDNIKKEGKRFICYTESNKKLEVRLRFKNSLGLAFPALQLKNIDKTNAELKEICNIHNIHYTSRMRKKDLKTLLTTNNIEF